MRRLKLLGLVLVALGAMAAAVAGSALGLELPENLPELISARVWSVTNIGNTTLAPQGQEPIVCTSVDGEGLEVISKPPKGTFHARFEGCTTKAGGVSVKCTGLGDPAGFILVSGAWSLVFAKLIILRFENLTSGILFKNEAIHFTCGGLVLVEALAGGETLCLHIDPTFQSDLHEFRCLGEYNLHGGEKKSNS